MTTLADIERDLAAAGLAPVEVSRNCSSCEPGLRDMNSLLQSTHQLEYRSRQRWSCAKSAVESYLASVNDIEQPGSIDVASITAQVSRTGKVLRDHVAVRYLDDMWAVRLALVKARGRASCRDWRVWCEARVGSRPIRHPGMGNENVAELTDAEERKLERELESLKMQRGADASGLSVERVTQIVRRLDEWIDLELDRQGRLRG